MRWLVDGYNVIRRDPELRAREGESLEAGRAALVRLLAGAARRSGDDFVAVFDGVRRIGGTGASPAGGSVQVLFSEPPDRADDLLVRLARRWQAGGVVVSSDRAVHRAALRAGAVAVTTDEFLDAVARSDRPPDEPADAADDEEEEGEETTWPGFIRRGNPHRISREARAAARVLGRLRPR